MLRLIGQTKWIKSSDDKQTTINVFTYKKKQERGVYPNAVTLKLLIKEMKDSGEEQKDKAQLDSLCSPEHTLDHHLDHHHTFCRRAACGDSHLPILILASVLGCSSHSLLPLQCLHPSLSSGIWQNSQGYFPQCLLDPSEFGLPNSGERSWLLPGASMLLHTAIFLRFSSPATQVGTKVHQQVCYPNGKRDANIAWCFPPLPGFGRQKNTLY